MTTNISHGDRSFTFLRKPKPISGDMRIIWRMSVTLLLLLNSRGKKASMAKLHILNDAIRSQFSRQKLIDMLNGATPLVHWRIRVEPAFSRNLDFLVGEGFAEWKASSGRASLALTKTGIEAAKCICAELEPLKEERAFIETTSKLVTEQFAQSVVAAGKHLI